MRNIINRDVKVLCDSNTSVRFMTTGNIPDFCICGSCIDPYSFHLNVEQDGSWAYNVQQDSSKMILEAYVEKDLVAVHNQKGTVNVSARTISFGLEDFNLFLFLDPDYPRKLVRVEVQMLVEMASEAPVQEEAAE